MNNIAIVVSNSNKNCTPIETIDSITKSGFNNVFVQWYNKEFEISQEEQLEYIKSQNLNVIFAHLGYKNINDLWLSKNDMLVSSYIHDLDICHKNNISLVIMHLIGKEDIGYNEIGLSNLRKIVKRAEELNMKIAFENTSFQGYLEYVIDNIKSDNIGICFDSGHYHCHFKDKFNFDKFKNKILAVHLHDNDMSKDQHLIPFDGTNDWNNIIDKLKQCNYNGPITLESVYQNDYLNMSLDEFYNKSYETALKIENKLNK